MNCSKHQHVIDLVGDMDRLPPAVARHVAECAACERFGRELLELRALLREPGRVAAPDDFDARLARRLRAAPTTAAPHRAWARVFSPQRGLAAAAAVAVLLAGAGAMRTMLSAPNDGSAIATSEISRPGNHAPGGDVGTAPPIVAPGPKPFHAGSAEISQVRQRFVSRNAVATRPQTMIFVRDAGGSRVMNVPAVLVGAEQIVPVSTSMVSADADSARIAF